MEVKNITFKFHKCLRFNHANMFKIEYATEFGVFAVIGVYTVTS